MASPAEASAERLRLLRAAHTLAASQMRRAGDEEDGDHEELAAIHLLSAAPPRDHWHRALLIGLRSPVPEVVDAVVEVVTERLRTLSDPEEQDRLMALILDACLWHLSGSSGRAFNLDSEAAAAESRRSALMDGAAGKLIAAITGLLERSPLELEHHRSRLLSSVRVLDYLPGRGLLAEQLARFQHTLALGERADQEVAGRLLDHRRFRLYTSSAAPESALEAYLRQDRAFPLEQVSQVLFRLYRMLFACQIKERSQRAILLALDNLKRWLDQTPQTLADIGELLGEAIDRIGIRVPREHLDIRLCRHLEAHLELVPGPEHEEDLLHQLRTRYDTVEGREVLLIGLDLLERLPLLRYRSEELCDFVRSPGRKWRDSEVWFGFLDLIEVLLTGLSNFVLARGELDECQQRQRLLRQRILIHDQRLRELLYEMSTDRKFELSTVTEVEEEVRERAWRVLLRVLPDNCSELIEEGLLRRGERFFFATLEEATAAHRRDVWPLLLQRWDTFTGGEPSAERRRRLAAVAAAFVATRSFAGVVHTTDGIGPLATLALDDADPEVREATERAMVAAGYGLELERERQRRELEALREALDSSNQRIVELEQRVDEFSQQATTTQLGKAERGLEVQDLLQRRDTLVTGGWLDTAEVQVDLEEVRDELAAAIRRAARQLELLQQLGQQLDVQLVQAREIHGVIERLVGEQRQQEAEIARLQAEIRQAEGRAHALQADIQSCEQERHRLQQNPPSPPSPTADDAAQNRALQQDHQNRMAQHRRRIADLGRRIGRLYGEVDAQRSNIASCQRRSAAAERQRDRLQGQIDQTRSRLGETRSQIRALEGRFASIQAACQAVRREINRLRARQREIEARRDGETRRRRGQLDANTADIQRQQAQLEEIGHQLTTLSSHLNQTSDHLARQFTESQRLLQAIDSGREHYDRVGESADRESGLADRSGESLQLDHGTGVRAAQEHRVLYAEALRRGLRGEPASPTRNALRRRRRQRRKNPS